MNRSGITYNEMEGLRDCPSEESYDGRHNTVEVYVRRPRDFFRKTFWFRCFHCNGRWKHYTP